MAFFAEYNPPITSTQAAATDPSSAALIAELDSTNFLIPSTNSPPYQAKDRLYSVSVWLGGSSNALWAVERATSTSIADNAILEQWRLRTSVNQTSQFVFGLKMNPTDRIRVRMPSTVTGTYEAKLQAQEIA